jgi:hypothetical protein
MRAPASSGSPWRSVAAGPAASGRLSGTVPTTAAGGVASLSSAPASVGGSDRGAGVTVRGRVSRFGEGVWFGGVCACAPANEVAMTSNPAREILFIGNSKLTSNLFRGKQVSLRFADARRGCQ